MTGEHLERFEQEAEKELKRLGEELPVSEARILSPEVLKILMANARSHGEVTYTSANNDYNVAFGFVEVRQDDGKLGFYDDLPEELTPEDAETTSFMVRGLHSKGELEVQFSEGKILLNKHTELEHVVEFQRAILKKGII